MDQDLRDLVDQPIKRPYDDEEDGGATRATKYRELLKTVLGRIGIEPDDKEFEEFPMIDRKSFITQDGLMGLGPQCMEKGDIFCVLFGGQCLYALRPTQSPGEYLYVGDCYVHGLMYGEAMEGYEKGEVEAQFFTLF
jgi:hypothetical protein